MKKYRNFNLTRGTKTLAIRTKHSNYVYIFPRQYLFSFAVKVSVRSKEALHSYSAISTIMPTPNSSARISIRD